MQKLINYLIFGGAKWSGEIILLKTSKELQKFSNKNFKKLLKLCLIYSVPIFKISTLIINIKKKNQTKNTFSVIKKKKTRFSLAIKFIIKIIKDEKSICFYKKISKKLLSISKSESSIIEIKKELQEQVFLKKHIFYYYRWR